MYFSAYINTKATAPAETLQTTYPMKENAIRILRSALENAEQCAKESEGNNILAQTAFKAGWYKNAIRTALEELEN